MTMLVFLGGVLAALGLGFGVMAGSAKALACNPDINPDCTGGGGQTTTTIATNLTVSVPSLGSVSDGAGGGINCGNGGTDCTQRYTYTQTCLDLDCTNSGVDTVTLTASRAGTGFVPNWSGCSSVANGACTVVMDTDHSVSVSWTDTQDPTVSLTSPASNAKVGASAQVNATAGDNDAVRKVDFFVDNVLKASDTSAPYAATLDMTPYAHESTHTITARATDTSGRISLGSSRSVTVDRQVSVNLVAPTPARDSLTNETSPQVAFTTDADVPAANIQCRTNAGTVSGGAFAACSSPYTPPTPNDGPYTVDVKVTDDVGNTVTASRTFTVDRTAPSAPLISAPANNSRLTTASFAVSGTAEANSQVELFDGTTSRGTATADATGNWSVGLSGVANGSHTYTAKATDAAGNASGASSTRTVTVDTIKPTVKSVAPANLATGVGPTNNVTAVFSEKMKATTINGKTFKLFPKGSTKPVAATVTYDAALRKATLDPDAGLRRGVTYKATITTGAKDLAGNALSASKTWSFTVKK